MALATSYDVHHPPENVLEPGSQFWTTTGMYPQELVLDRKNTDAISMIRVTSCNARKVQFEQAGEDQVFQKLADRELECLEGKVQVTTLNMKLSCRYLKLIISAGGGDFASVIGVDLR